MAVSRVGGTKSLVSGKVGDVVYSIVKDGNGGYRQDISALPEGRALALTPELARQRLFMSIVMRHMNLLTNFMAAAFEDVPEGTLSVQEFARINLRWLQNYYSNPPGSDYTVWWPKYGVQFALPAPIIVTQGTFRTTSIAEVHRIHSSSYGYIRVYFDYMYPNMTMRQWMQSHNLMLREYLCELVMTMGADAMHPSYEYVRFVVNSLLDLDRPCFEISSDEFFKTDGSLSGTFGWEDVGETDRHRLRFETFRYPNLNNIASWGTLQFGEQYGKWRLSRSQMLVNGTLPIGPLRHVTFEEAFKTWFDDRL